MNRIVWSLLLVLMSGAGFAQVSITNGDGTALTQRYCYNDTNYLLAGIPAGGSFSGCGILERNGQWYFNPVAATNGVSVFPYQCPLTYTATNRQLVSRNLLIDKPVVISPSMADIGLCVDTFLLQAKMLYAGAYDYVWSPAAFLERPDTSFTKGGVQQTTTFVLTATDRVSGCKGTDTVTVTRYPVPVLKVTPSSVTINSRGTVQLLASGAEYYEWTPYAGLSHPGIANPVASPQGPVIYTVVGYNSFSCSDTAEVSIDVNETLALPNAFTPNGDGKNDFFAVKNMAFQGVHSFRIFDRWGRMIFETRDAAQGWDGTIKGISAEQGMYFYEIRLSLRDGTAKIFKGDVMLMR
ncbi:MAG: gliding motility-associated C-terminal domain-containing protein [Sphingobacteriales bacterium]|nr:MAG: gliding motility-associated C-terminal domain-containing protein [Sphingobacteriales bacterium]